jgi:hypothetical protein
MALVAYEGFDHYAAAPTDVLNRRGGGLQWNSESGMSFVTPGRNGAGSAIKVGIQSNLQGALTVPLASGYIGYAAFFDPATLGSGGNPDSPFMQISDLISNVVQLELVFNLKAASIQVWRGNHLGLPFGVGTLIATTPNNVITNLAWTFVEFFITISNTGGAVQIRCNGQTVLNASGLDTQNGGLAQFDGITFCGPEGTAATITVDDVYIADTSTGSGPFPLNIFAGDVRVITLHTVGNVGTPGWTPLALTNWQEVSEVHNDGDASYNSTATVGAKDLFNFQPLAGTISVVLAVQITGAYRKDDAGTRLIANHLVSGGTEVAGFSYSIPNAYVYASDIFVLDPNGSTPWTVASVNALQAGYALVA